MEYNKPMATALAVLLAGSMALTGCSGKKGDDGVASQSAGGTPVADNEQPRDKMDQGGTFTYTVGAIEGNFNNWSTAGNTTDVSDLLDPMNAMRCYNYNADGSMYENKDVCEKVTEKIENGKQTLTFKLNPKAKWNDGADLNAAAMENQWKMLSLQTVPDLDVTNPEAWKTIESVKQGADENEVIVTTKKVYEPYQDLFFGFMHPAMKDKASFTTAWEGKIHDEWLAGPFKLEKLDMAQRNATLVPNDKWWGEKPMLDRIVIREMTTKASIPAFKNGQIDVIGAGNVNRYNQLKGTKDSEFRRGNRTSVFGLVLNSRAAGIQDPEMRKAIFQAINRKNITEIRFKGLNWTEQTPGSWGLTSYNPMYKDVYPVKDNDPQGAEETLKAAGYTKGADGFYGKGGTATTVSLQTWGDDPVGTAMLTSIIGHLKKAGIKATIDQRAESNFNADMAKNSFAIAFMGYTVGADATGWVQQAYVEKGAGNSTGCGSKEIDDRINKVSSIQDIKERNAEALAIESDWNKKCYGMLSIFSGPAIMATNKYLANYGPAMYKGWSLDWTKVGWMKGHKKG